MVETAEGPVDRMDNFEESSAHADPERSLQNSALEPAHRDRARRVDAARAHGFRTAPLPGTAAARHRRNAGDQRGSRQELPVPRHAEDARGAGGFRMNCEDMVKSIPLYFYGELPPEEEERVEDHLDGCEPCRGELERLRSVAAALDRREMARARRAVERMPRQSDGRDPLGRRASPHCPPTAAPRTVAGREILGAWGGAVGIAAADRRGGICSPSATSRRSSLPRGSSRPSAIPPNPWWRACARCSRMLPAACGFRSKRCATGWSPDAWTTATSSGCCWPPRATKPIPGCGWNRWRS